jgi:hypothetical protein
MRSGLLTLILVLVAARPSSAEWQIKPFFGLSFGSSTTFVLNEEIDDPKTIFGVGATWLGEIVGVEADFGLAPGFLGDSSSTVLSSRLTTLTGNVVIALPKHLAQYSLRPYFVGGAGFVRVRQQDNSDALPVDSTLALFDIGGGVTGFLSDRVGVNWDLRRFHSLGGSDGSGLSFGPERVSFWRASMGLALRY